jgi:CheY-like chemotaxis protein
MNGILGMTELLQDTPLDSVQTRYVQALSSAANALHELLGDILDLSKIEEGKVQLERVEFDPAALLVGVAGIYRELARARGVDVLTTIELPTLPRVRGDPTRLRQVVTNLLGNALKFTSEGTVSLRATIDGLPDVDGRTRLLVSVQDTGIGMTPEQQAQIFQRFSQADSSTTRRFGGSGLGLAICKHLVELMGGAIRADSTPGRGSTFSFDVPVDAVPLPDGPASATQAGPANAGSPLPRLAHVLVVEDNPVNCLVVQAMLERLGMTVTLASDGSQALPAMEAHPVDLVLMDCQMPVMDGYEATLQIRASCHPRANLPIIALTAHALAEDRQRCDAAGMNDYLPKPVTGEMLAAMLQRHLGSRPLAGDCAPSPLQPPQPPAARSVGGSNLPSPDGCSIADTTWAFRPLVEVARCCDRPERLAGTPVDCCSGRFRASLCPHPAFMVPMRRRFSARHTSLNSACTRCRPRRLNCRNPSTLLIQPLGGSAIHLRRR